MFVYVILNYVTLEPLYPMHDLSQYLNFFVMASTCELQTNMLKTLNVMI